MQFSPFSWKMLSNDIYFMSTLWVLIQPFTLLSNVFKKTLLVNGLMIDLKNVPNFKLLLLNQDFLAIFERFSILTCFSVVFLCKRGDSDPKCKILWKPQISRILSASEWEVCFERWSTDIECPIRSTPFWSKGYH